LDLGRAGAAPEASAAGDRPARARRRELLGPGADRRDDHDALAGRRTRVPRPAPPAALARMARRDASS